MKEQYTDLKKKTSQTFFQRLKKKQPPFFSKLFLYIISKEKHLKTFTGHTYDFFIDQVHLNNNDQNKQKLYLSDLELELFHKFFKVTISSIKHNKNTITVTIELHFYYHSPYKTTLPLGVLGCEAMQHFIFLMKEHRAYRVNNI